MDANTSAITNRALYADAIDGLSQTPKGLSPKWFYDAVGSEIFEEITQLAEYYPGRTERAILESQLPRIAAHVPDGAALVELGSGASVKTRLLLDGLPQLSGYVPVDISEDFLHATAAELAEDYPSLGITPVVADFMTPVRLPDLGGAPVAGFFPGSTIGNLDPGAARALLARLADWRDHEVLILGVDLVKAAGTLVAAYDDSDGVTARFNLNLLTRLNREAGASFDLDTFRHLAVWNAVESRVEMHLESLQDQVVRLGEREVAFSVGETIHTENSHKYTVDGLSALAA
ncbi:L-histidine N(alpha)-methyltransferase, partial [Roseovarius tibetensis]|uniref:L-histidine N(alpha)-methyltransferase n=1 Tax=Roseovarius tibetensis TaxID=2685897 RepID=UPI003D7FB264